MQQCDRCDALLKQVAELQKRLRTSWDEVFWTKVDRRGPDECWLWRGAVNRGTGYGNYHIPNGIKIPELASGPNAYAHRAAFYLHTGIPLTTGDVIAHRCDQRICCNPFHLFRTTHDGNVQDKVNKGRAWRKLTADTYAEVVSAIKSGEPVPAVADRHGISKGYAYVIASGRRKSRAKGQVNVG